MSPIFFFNKRFAKDKFEIQITVKQVIDLNLCFELFFIFFLRNYYAFLSKKNILHSLNIDLFFPKLSKLAINCLLDLSSCV